MIKKYYLGILLFVGIVTVVQLISVVFLCEISRLPILLMLQPDLERSHTPFYRKIHGSVKIVFFFSCKSVPPENLEC